ncbi:MAG TPA: serine hydrolase domain-containing protein [Gemmatimonadales bacterium]
MRLPRLTGACLLAALLVPSPVPAQDPAPSPAPRRGVTDRVELEGFLDGVMAAFLRDKHIAGATISVVKDGELFFAKGYGWADVDRRIPVDPERTLFRIGSVSKLFTWTAVMQQAEQGKLDLDADVNSYLDFVIPATWPEPITLTHALTHTPGFEEDGRDLFTTDPAQITPMGTWLPAHMPARVRPPGTFSSYSNWATGLAGYIVERTSGQSYDDYLEAHLFGPLGMVQATARQPLPGPLAADMSQGYVWKDGRYEAKPFEIVKGAAPAGSMSASATAMARFMIAHLNGGALGEARILAPETAARMHARAFGHDDRLPGFALGFYEKTSHGLRIIGHGGDTQLFHSDLALFPSENLGIFISTNTDNGSQISFGPFLQTFLDHYFPEPPRPSIALTKEETARFAGSYLFNRMSYTTWQKVTGLLGGQTIAAADSGVLLVNLGLGDPLRMVPVDSLLFQDPLSGTLLSFRTDAAGNVTHGFVDMIPMMTLEKQTGLADPKLHQAILVGALLLFAALVIAALVRWLNRKTWTYEVPAGVVRGRRIMVLVALLQFGFIAVVAGFASNIERIMSGPWTALKVGLALPVAGLVLTLAAGWIAIGLWRQGTGTIGARLRLTVTVAASLAFFLVLNHWNLLGWKF